MEEHNNLFQDGEAGMFEAAASTDSTTSERLFRAPLTPQQEEFSQAETPYVVPTAVDTVSVPDVFQPQNITYSVLTTSNIQHPVSSPVIPTDAPVVLETERGNIPFHEVQHIVSDAGIHADVPSAFQAENTVSPLPDPQYAVSGTDSRTGSPSVFQVENHAPVSPDIQYIVSSADIQTDAPSVFESENHISVSPDAQYIVSDAVAQVDTPPIFQVKKSDASLSDIQDVVSNVGITADTPPAFTAGTPPVFDAQQTDSVPPEALFFSGVAAAVSPIDSMEAGENSGTEQVLKPLSAAPLITGRRVLDMVQLADDAKEEHPPALYHAILEQEDGQDDLSGRSAHQGKRAAVSGTAMTFGAAKATAAAVKKQIDFTAQTSDFSNGLIQTKAEFAKISGKFAAKQGSELFTSAASRVFEEAVYLAEDFQGSEDLGVQAIAKTKDVVRSVSAMHRLFGSKKKTSPWKPLQQVPSAASAASTLVRGSANKLFTGVAAMTSSIGVLPIAAFLLALLLAVLPVAYALTGASSLSSDDNTLTEVYSYITELDANLSRRIAGYSRNADVVNYFLNDAQNEDGVTITTNPDPILQYLDCVYGDYTFSEVKNEIDDIYEAVYHLSVTTYTQDVSSTSEEEVIDPSAPNLGGGNAPLDYTPVYSSPVQYHGTSTLTTAILNHANCLGTFRLTFYCGCAACSEQWGTQTSTGATATEGRTIAVDPSVIPYGTKVHIDGWGDFIAEDCGGAIRGNRIDIFVENHARCNTLGVQYAAVYAMDSSVTGGIFIPGISQTTVSHLDVHVTTQPMSTYLQGLLTDDQAEKAELMNQIGQYTTRMNFGSPIESEAWFIARRYGYYYENGSVNEHSGIDVSITGGTCITAVCSGTVQETGQNNEHGKYLILKKGSNRFLYGNLGAIRASTGDRVSKGDVLASVGTTASSCEQHTVHIEYEKNDVSLNPSFYLYNASASGVSGNSSNDIVAVARSQLGQVGGQPYWSFMGFGSRVAWCASFVSWCANECGYIDSGIFPKFAACQAVGIPWFQSHGLWQDRSYTPVPGDIIFFDWGGDGHSDHVGIVEYVENGVVHTIEGNSSNAVHQRSYPVGDSRICGYGVPQYP